MLSRQESKTLETHLTGRDLAVVQGAIDTLEQGRHFLLGLSDEFYQRKVNPYVDSSIGEHFRHLLDVYRVLSLLFAGSNSQGVINYNHRRRGHLIERCRQQAIVETDQLIVWLEGLDSDDIKQSVQVLSDVSVCDCQSTIMTSTLERELTFVSLHANHHFAMTKVVVNLLGGRVSHEFGYAPTTLSYMRRA